MCTFTHNDTTVKLLYKEPKMFDGNFGVPFILFSGRPFSHGFAGSGIQRAASANTTTKGTGSEGGACEAFDV